MLIEKDEIKAYQHRVAKITRTRFLAAQDYVAARCCLLNGIILPGYILAAQAVEKELKSIIMLVKPESHQLKKYRHDLVRIIDDLNEIYNINLLIYKSFVETLSLVYKSRRYADDKAENSVQYLSNDILADLDNMFLTFAEFNFLRYNLKYHNGVLAIMLSEKNHPIKFWALKENVFFEKNLARFKEEKKQ